jgi:hypothetical protein
MKKYKKCSGQCVECVLFYTVEGCGSKHSGEDNFISLSETELDRLITLYETLEEEGYAIWMKEINRRLKLKNIISLTKK